MHQHRQITKLKRIVYRGRNISYLKHLFKPMHMYYYAVDTFDLSRWHPKRERYFPTPKPIGIYYKNNKKRHVYFGHLQLWLTIDELEKEFIVIDA